MRNISYGIVKAHAYERRDEIKDLIRKSGLEIVAEKSYFQFTPELARLHCALLPKETFPAAVERLTNGPTNPLIVMGDNAITRLRTLAGKECNSSDCAPGTIRRTFGNEYQNAFHRSVRAREVGREIPITFDQNELPGYVLDALWDYPRFGMSMFAMGKIDSLTPRFSL